MWFRSFDLKRCQDDGEPGLSCKVLGGGKGSRVLWYRWGETFTCSVGESGHGGLAAVMMFMQQGHDALGGVEYSSRLRLVWGEKGFLSIKGAGL